MPSRTPSGTPGEGAAASVSTIPQIGAFARTGQSPPSASRARRRRRWSAPMTEPWLRSMPRDGRGRTSARWRRPAAATCSTARSTRFAGFEQRRQERHEDEDRRRATRRGRNSPTGQIAARRSGRGARRGRARPRRRVARAARRGASPRGRSAGRDRCAGSRSLVQEAFGQEDAAPHVHLALAEVAWR